MILRASHLGCAALTAAIAAAACTGTPYREAQVSLEPRDAAPVAEAPRTAQALRFSVAAMESPRDTYAAYSRLFERMGERLGMDVDFVQRRTYREVNDLLASGQLDAALVCTGGYLDLRRRAPGAIEVLVVPVVHGRSTFHSLVIVPSEGGVTDFHALAGKRFAYTDELSFTGRAYVIRFLEQQGRDPNGFFGATMFTHSHDRSINAVAKGIVDGAAVHSLIYEHLVKRDPALAAQTRVILRSPAFGMMPVVVSKRLPEPLRARLRDVLIGLATDPEGAAALRVLDIERFTPPAPGLFDTAAQVVEARR